jgi:hypothetical protein
MAVTRPTRTEVRTSPSRLGLSGLGLSRTPLVPHALANSACLSLRGQSYLGQQQDASP